MLGHKTSLNNIKNTESISSILSDHKAMKLDINYKKKIWRLNNILLNNKMKR